MNSLFNKHFVKDGEEFVVPFDNGGDEIVPNNVWEIPESEMREEVFKVMRNPNPRSINYYINSEGGHPQIHEGPTDLVTNRVRVRLFPEGTDPLNRNYICIPLDR